MRSHRNLIWALCILVLISLSAFMRRGVSGYVVDDVTGRPIAGAVVRLYVVPDFEPFYQAEASTDAMGHFVFPSNTIKEDLKYYFVCGEKQGYQRSDQELTTFLNGIKKIGLKSDASISGVVLDRKGHPVKACDVWLSPSDLTKS